jgi:hypothetical protein
MQVRKKDEQEPRAHSSAEGHGQRLTATMKPTPHPGSETALSRPLRQNVVLTNPGRPPVLWSAFLPF